MGLVYVFGILFGIVTADKLEMEFIAVIWLFIGILQFV